MSEATFANLPPLPVPHDQLVKHLAEHPDTPMQELLAPYRKYEADLRSVFAQDRNNTALNDPTINVLPLFTNDTKLVTTRARDLASESQEEKDRYMMPLPDEKRRPHGSPAVVADIKEFQKNFGVFSESSLCDVDWSNVVAAGSSVINCLLPVPAEYNTTKRKLREYYHQIFCPASDVDLFLYGLTHEQAIEKIKSIEQAVRDALLSEVTIVRTKYAITIASQYPTRHIQIVLRVYKSIGEILTGFDIDAAGGAYDGSQVYVTPRALGSFITQTNHIDLTRRSPSYENRLSKYSRRAFEVYWPELERSRIDPTIYERSFGRSLGLARLLVMERLPNSSARDQYINKRRQERGRPTFTPNRFRMGGNIKDNFEDEVADWVDEADVSNYHTFTVPYGENFHAKKIEKLCYTLLNAEWNQHKDRTVYLHRHPAFFGRVQDVIQDCCGTCPEPVTEEEQEVAAKESEIYISGKVAFLIDDPGRQQIGSFNPLTANDWTDMAYVGNTARLCQSIVDGALDEVKEQLDQDGADPNKRDYTGRTPLQLAVQCSTPEVVRALVESGARITARILDGRTALHMAAARGDGDIIKTLLDKSNANEEAEEEKQDLRRRAKKAASEPRSSRAGSQAPASQDDNEMGSGSGKGAKSADADGDLEMDDGDGELIEAESTTDRMSMTSGSFVKVDAAGDAVEQAANQEAELDGSDDEPDFFKIDMLAWDVPCSPLHLAIVNGHEEAVKILCDYGADSLLPIKFLDDDKMPVGAILTLVLSLCLPEDKAESMARVLLRLGSTSSQADMDGCTAFHRFVAHGNEKFVQMLVGQDKTGVMAAVKAVMWLYSNTTSPLNTAIAKGDTILALRILEAGHKPEIDLDSWVRIWSAKRSNPISQSNREQNLDQYHNSVTQPLLDAIAHCPDPVLIKSLLDGGADPNWLSSSAWYKVHNEWQRTNKHYTGETALDIVRNQIKRLRKYKPEKPRKYRAPRAPKGTSDFAANFAEGSYARHAIDRDIKNKENTYKRELKRYRHDVKSKSKPDAQSDGCAEKAAALKEVLADYEQIEQLLLKAGAKGLYELHPNIKKGKNQNYFYSRYRPGAMTYGDANDEPYKFVFSFLGDTDPTDARTEAYIKMFEAAWNGDIETIKSYTLGLWGEDQTPLTASVQDEDTKNTIFSIAFLRGHYDVAKAILDIVEAQHEPEEGAKLAYKIKGARNDDDDDECDSEEEDGGDDDIKIVSHDVGEKKFTIDNIGEVATQVKCKTRPITVLQYSVDCFETKDGKVMPSCGDSALHVDLFQWAVHTKDQKAVNLLIDLGIHFSNPKRGGNEDASLFIFPVAAFNNAVTNGPIPIVSDIIRRTGAGLPLDHLVKKTGREIKEKAKFYQGLTVYGKKRKDWANAGRNVVIRNIGSKTPPVLDVAKTGELELLKWFLSETPQQLYTEFANSKVAEGEKRFKHLAETPGGLERVISKWLGVQNDLLIHCAVTGPTTEKGQKVLKWIIDNNPHNLETKTTSGLTPFLLACNTGRLEFVKILIDAGANQLARNNDGSNAIHLALETSPPTEKLKEFLNLLDSGVRSHLFMQRNNLSVSGTTPFHTWLCGTISTWNGDVQKVNLEMFKLLLEFSGGAEIEMLNGAGDTCLHTAVMQRATPVVEALLEYRPKLLLRENAVGRTPAEVAYDFVTAQKFKQPRKLESLNLHTRAGNNIMEKSADDFVDKATGKPVSKSDWYAQGGGRSRIYGNSWWSDETQEEVGRKVWEICQGFMEKLAASGEDKRRLVSLHEANDVARRLGEQYRGADKTVNLVRRHGDENADMPDEEKASSAGGEDDPELRKTDYVGSTIGSSIWTAWYSIKTPEKCDVCGKTRNGHQWVNYSQVEKEEDDDEPVEGEDEEMGEDDDDEGMEDNGDDDDDDEDYEDDDDDDDDEDDAKKKKKAKKAEKEEAAKKEAAKEEKVDKDKGEGKGDDDGAQSKKPTVGFQIEETD